MAKLIHPANLRYADTHEWVRVEGDEAVIGISDYAQDSLGDVVYLDLQSKGGQQVKKGGHFGDIESVKATSELYAPVSGTVLRVNEALRDQAELVNSDPYGEGWMLVIKMSNPADLDKLMDATAYTHFLDTSGH